MKPIHVVPIHHEQLDHLHIQCSACNGLCCTALFFSKVDGFPNDKPAGKPCLHLQEDFLCNIHEELNNRHMKGCISYDCFGAGQLTTQMYQGKTWKSHPRQANDMFATFLNLYHLQHIAWYLLEASTLSLPKQYLAQISSLQLQYETLRVSALQLTPAKIDEFRDSVNQVLKSIIQFIQKPYHRKPSKNHQYIGKNLKGKDLNGMDFAMSICIAANFEGCQLKGACFLGADMRDVNVCNTDLSDVLFLTQAQVNSMKGNAHTILGPMLRTPSHWK